MYFLLERLAAGGGTPACDLETAVAAQIQRIVAARVLESPDGAMSLIEFGMPNVVDLPYNSKTALARYGARLQRLIERYEPRLIGPGVKVEPSGSTLAPWRLVVSGRLAQEGELVAFRVDPPTH
jgi:predicted component of type VI protein secretion system